jgi:hypothetical protein
MFCTYLTIYRGNKLPPFYIGSSTHHKIQAGYHGSVSSKKYRVIWRAEIANNPHLFKTKILKTFSSRKEALASERNLQELLKVLDNPLYINQGIARGGFFVCKRTPEHQQKINESRKNYQHSLETRAKISKSKAGQPITRKVKMSDATKEKISKTLTGRKVKPESIAKRLASMVGFRHSSTTIEKMRKPKSDAHRENMKKAVHPRGSNNMWITDGIESRNVPKTTPIPFGWYRGKTTIHNPPSQKGKFWITNGIISQMSHIIPPGFWRGRLKKSK